MDENGEIHVGRTACFCDLTFGATREEAFGKESNVYFHRRKMVD